AEEAVAEAGQSGAPLGQVPPAEYAGGNPQQALGGERRDGDDSRPDHDGWIEEEVGNGDRGPGADGDEAGNGEDDPVRFHEVSPWFREVAAANRLNGCGRCDFSAAGQTCPGHAYFDPVAARQGCPRSRGR